MLDMLTAYRMHDAAEVQFKATVTSLPHTFVGTHGLHEAFDAQTAAGPVSIVDNVDIAPQIAVHPGDRIEVRGEMVHDAGQPRPIVHWTHHDPSGHHQDGFIRWNGRQYA